jgi:hypothetical protein
MREVGLFVKVGEAYKRLELFTDENIELSSSIQNVQDISKVFSDFTQGFTIPATTYNASIIHYFEESSINQIYDYQVMFDAYIEIDTIPFKRGKLQVDKSQIKDGNPYCYNVQFFGHLTSLKDTFGELKLSDLDLTPYSFEYSGANVRNRIIDGATDYDVRFPLISSERIWTYGDATDNDISGLIGALSMGELLPAIKVNAIIEAIETRFGIALNSVFFQSKAFNRLFLYLKNTSNDAISFNFDNLIFDSATGETEYRTANLTTSSLNYVFGEVLLFGSLVSTYQYQTSIKVTAVTSPTFNWSVQCLRNNILVNTISGQGTGEFVIFTEQNVNGLDANLTFRVNSESGNTIDIEVINYILIPIFGEATQLDPLTIVCDSIAPNLDINLNAICPNIKISDFFSGILNMFNLTINPISATDFEVETLESWYSKGVIKNITLNTNDTYEVGRVKLYKQIDFRYQQSETILNRKFFGFNQAEYGNLRNVFQNDGSDFKIELPFENLLQQKFTDINIQVGYSVDINGQPITPKPMLLYMNDGQNISANPIEFFAGELGFITLNAYMPFGQDLQYNQNLFSLNWGAEISSFYLNVISNSLFATYWQTYLAGLYDLRQRLYTFQTMLPLSKLNSLKLNDRLVIEDKRYLINDYKTNLTTGMVNLTLLQDFRTILQPLIFNMPETAICFEAMIFIPNDANSFELTTETAGVTITPSTATVDSLINICIPDSSETAITTESEIDITTEDGEVLITEDSGVSTITILVTFDNGTTNEIIITRNA